MQCWGRNNVGQLGNGTTTDSLVAVDVQGLTSGVADVASGGDHSCALTVRGAVKCWGANPWGQLGNGTKTDSSVPVDVTGLTSGVLAIAAGGYHTVAIVSGGGVKAWGCNCSGQLGDGTQTIDSNVPVDVVGLESGIIAVAPAVGVDQAHTCGLTRSGGVKCWGDDTYGQLGDGRSGMSNPDGTTTSHVPIDVIGLASGVTAVASAAYSSCAITTSGAVKCWGYNDEGALGDGTTTNRVTPVDVAGPRMGSSRSPAATSTSVRSPLGPG